MNYQDRLLGVVSPNEDKDDLSIRIDDISKLTKAGEELYYIMTRYGMTVREDDFFIRYMENLSNCRSDLRIQLFRSKRIEDGSIVANGPDMIGKDAAEIERLIGIPVI